RETRRKSGRDQFRHRARGIEGQGPTRRLQRRLLIEILKDRRAYAEFRTHRSPNDAEAAECSCGGCAAKLRAATGSREPILPRLQNVQGPDIRRDDQRRYRRPGAPAATAAWRPPVAYLLADGGP